MARLTPVQIDELAESLRRTLAAVQAGELSASALMVQRLTGALVALEVAQGQGSSLLDDPDLDSK